MRERPTARILIASCVLACAGTFASSGCAVAMAARQPTAKDLSVLQPGHTRAEVVAELGWPEYSEMRDGARVDRFSITQGYSKGARVGRAVWHGLADAVTLGAWELIGTPTEMIFDGQDLRIEVGYDANDKVVNSQVRKRK